MSVLELHPEHLVDAMREGRLTAADRVRLQAHCARCSACMFELRWVEQSDVSAEPSAADRAYGQAAFDSVLRTHGSRSRDAAAKTFSWSVRHAWLVGILLACGVSAAFLAPWSGGGAGHHAVASSLRTRVPEAVEALDCAPPVRVEDVSFDRTQALHKRARSVVTFPSANQLLASARLAYTRGDVERALRLYRQVVQRYASASAAGAAQIALGRLLYEEKAQPSAALVEFDDYLHRRPGGTLSEEALFFRALSLDRLGKPQQAEDTLHKLLRLYPRTVYAASAGIRLAAPRADVASRH